MIFRYLGYLLVFKGGWMLIQRVTATAPSSADIDTATTTPLFHAVIEFADAQKRAHSSTLPGGDVEPKPPRGTRVRRRYRLRNPDDACLATFAQMWVMPISWLAAGRLRFSSRASSDARTQAPMSRLV